MLPTVQAPFILDSMNTYRDAVTVVLHHPMRQVNIASSVRAMKNMGLRQLRLVAPREYTPELIEQVAHRSEDVVSRITVHDTLADALHDMQWVVGTTARIRDTPLPPDDIRGAMPQIAQRAANGQRIALLFGPEDNGLQKAELDLCHQSITIDTDPEYASLNLAQAVLLVCYELHMVVPPVRESTRITYPPASSARIEEFLQTLEQTLRHIDFFKSPSAHAKMRSLRSMTHRAQPNGREIMLLQAICREAIKVIQRLQTSRDTRE
jgi:TrmH family RNA methyltransferase